MSDPSPRVPPSVPFGMTEVSKAEFFRLLSAAEDADLYPRPYHDAPDYLVWETKHRRAWGWSTPGWLYAEDPDRYAVRDDAPGWAVRAQKRGTEGK